MEVGDKVKIREDLQPHGDLKYTMRDGSSGTTTSVLRDMLQYRGLEGIITQINAKDRYFVAGASGWNWCEHDFDPNYNADTVTIESDPTDIASQIKELAARANKLMGVSVPDDSIKSNGMTGSEFEKLASLASLSGIVVNKDIWDRLAEAGIIGGSKNA